MFLSICNDLYAPSYVYVVIPSGSRSVFVVSFHKPEKSHKVAAQQNLNILFSLNYINLYITTKSKTA